jgi:hypothetical protein
MQAFASSAAKTLPTEARRKMGNASSSAFSDGVSLI